MTIDQILSPIQHQRMIDRLTSQLSLVYSDGHNAEILKRIQWHVEMYLAKIGKLPR